MKVILTTNVKKLGKVGELVNVKDGYARNFLLPKKMALRENKKTQSIMKKLKKKLKLTKITNQNKPSKQLKILKS